MANKLNDCVGEVDVISDSENIKRLLKIPFSGDHVSLMVHRVGKTILLDEFDVPSYLLQQEEKHWKWLRKFLMEHILMEQMKENIILRKNTRRNIQDKSMFNKFLLYSLNGSNDNENQMYDDFCKSENVEEPQKTSPHLTVSPKKCFSDLDDGFYGNLVDKSSSDQNNSQYGYLRNLLWTFEDIHMLVGSDMPIFGDSKHPAVSLKLRDMTKPINVLTGIDYWLDNLMCSVPEVVMCYHLDGIVQKYELIKTEDIPRLQSSTFSPKIVRNIAQNLLTFLKSKATKEGHTYWLFKGKNDDVVKLYDLSSLCGNYMDEDDCNPYSVPVANLLLRVAENLRNSSNKYSSTAYKLLINCLKLINSNTPYKHKEIAVRTRFMLSEILISSDLNPSILTQEDVHQEEDDEFFSYFNDDKGSRSSTPVSEDSGDENVNVLPVNRLILANSFDWKNRKNSKEEKKNSRKAKESSENPSLGSCWPKKCQEAISHVIEGLNYLRSIDSKSFDEKKTQTPDQPKMAKPFEAIPMSYCPLKEVKSELNHYERENISEKEQKIDGNEVVTPETLNGNEDELTFKETYSILFTQKTCLIFAVMAEIYKNLYQFEESITTVKMGINCFLAAEKLLLKNRKTCSRDYLGFLLTTAGDIYAMKGRNNKKEGENSNIVFNYKDIMNLLKELSLVNEEDSRNTFHWIYSDEQDINLDVKINLSIRCFEAAVDCFKEKDLKEKANKINLSERILKRLGNALNELGCYYMNEANKLFNDAEEINNEIQLKLETLTSSSLSILKRGVQIFESLNDVINTVLLLSNSGRLMRVCAHVFAPLSSDKTRSSEFSTKERSYYNKAIKYYENALERLKVPVMNNKEFENIWDYINWDICTTYYTVGCLMQELAPLTHHAYETVEKDIRLSFEKALKCCENGGLRGDASRKHLYEYRMASIHNKLGSLYHHSFRNMGETDDKRKQTFNISDKHYENAMELHKEMENSIDYLTCLLERVALHEHLLSSLTGFVSKLKILHIILNLLTCKNEIQEASSISGEDDPDAEKLLKLFVLLEERIYLCVKGLIKTYSSKPSKHKDILIKWKDVDKFINLKRNKSSANSYERQIAIIRDRLCDYCDKIRLHLLD